MLRRTQRRRGRGDDGAAAVEFAILALLLVTILFGIIEFAFVMRDWSSVSAATRAGVRTAATGAGSGPCVVLGVEKCGPGVPVGVPLLAQQAADSIQRAGTAMPQDSIDGIWVYRANTSGFPGPDTVDTGGEATTWLNANCISTNNNNCVYYRWVDNQKKFRWQGGLWTSSTINACINDANAQSVGVIMKATRPFFTGLFPWVSLPLTDRSVAKFEPLPNTSCNGNGPTSGGHD